MNRPPMPGTVLIPDHPLIDDEFVDGWTGDAPSALPSVCIRRTSYQLDEPGSVLLELVDEGVLAREEVSEFLKIALLDILAENVRGFDRKRATYSASVLAGLYGYAAHTAENQEACNRIAALFSEQWLLAEDIAHALGNGRPPDEKDAGESAHSVMEGIRLKLLRASLMAAPEARLHLRGIFRQLLWRYWPVRWFGYTLFFETCFDRDVSDWSPGTKELLRQMSAAVASPQGDTGREDARKKAVDELGIIVGTFLLKGTRQSMLHLPAEEQERYRKLSEQWIKDQGINNFGNQ
jgi:hypothetical protein